ncbi:MAG: DegT/DnrJ/EryC1/StrS aminotransferase family protein, partial [Betaproteobacteria bacterium]
SIRAELISEHVTARTRAIVVAHLFGSRMAMEPISAAARRHELLVIEDCAQAFAADGYRGSAQSDVSLFSFGPIKTSTALGGALLRVSDAGLRTAMLARQRKYPGQRRAAYVRKLMKCAALK